MPVVFSRGYLTLVGQIFNTVHCHASGISVQPTWPSLYSAKCHRISSCVCSLVFSQRLKEPPMHILGLLFCVSPSSLVPCPANVRCPSNCGFWSLFVLPSEIAPFCLGSSSPSCPQTQCGPHLMCCTISKITALHCLPSTWKQLVRILPSLMVNHNGSESNACDSTVARTRSDINLLINLWASEPDQWFSNLSMPQNPLLEALFLRVAQVGKGCSSICISNEFPGDSNVVHTKTTFWRTAGLDPCFQPWLVVHKNHLERF